MNNKNTPINIPIEKLHPFEGHPFKVLDNEEMNQLTQSIQELGILSPLIVRPKENTADEYEIVSGHRRFRAAVKAGMRKVPAFVVPMDRDAAAIALVDSNLHRDHLMPSEKAFAYKLKMDAMRHQGTSCQVGTKFRSDEQLAENISDSARQIQRYIRLTYLIPELLKKVDKGQIAFTPAVELSYLTGQEQEILLSEMEYADCTPSLSQAIRLHRFSREGRLNGDVAYAVMSEEKANQKEKLKIPVERVRKFFPKEYTAAQMEEEIVKMCESRYRKRQRDRDSR